MSWLQKRPQVSDPTMFYTVGLNKTVLLAGLGNRGQEYDGTRHNIGFACIDSFVSQNEDMSAWIQKNDLQCLMSTGQLADTRVIAIKPTSFMNLSGQALQAVSNFYKLSLDNVVVIHDELDIDFGQIRLRLGGSSAGHNGVSSIMQYLGEEFGRVRVGIGPKSPSRISAEKFVLQKFSTSEQSQLANLNREVNAILSEYVFSNSLPNETRSFLV